MKLPASYFSSSQLRFVTYLFVEGVLCFVGLLLESTLLLSCCCHLYSYATGFLLIHDSLIHDLLLELCQFVGHRLLHLCVRPCLLLSNLI